MKVLGAFGALVVGVLTGGAAVVLHDITWTLVLASIATALTLWSLPAGLRGRIPYAAGWMAVLALAVSKTDTGGYLVGSTAAGYAVLAVGLVALSVSIATFPLKRRRRLARDDQPTRNSDHLAG